MSPSRAPHSRWIISRLVAATLLVTGCAHTHSGSVGPTDVATSPVPTMYDTQRAIDEYVDSGQYERDVAAVVSQARVWLETRAPALTKPAVVLDVDETSLSNWPAYRVNGWVRIVSGDCDLEKGPCNIRKWQESARAAALPATLALARRAEQLGVAVFFITGRPADERAATERNLREQGYHFDRVILRPAGVYKSAVDFKAPARCAIEHEGYTIVLSLGDQRSDLDGGCAGRGFKLPNPVYFLP
jgi:predicted secreted acid phosphatase